MPTLIYRRPAPAQEKNRGLKKVLILAAFFAFVAACAEGPSSNITRFPQHKTGESVYVAEKGDTLEEIAKKFETTVEAIKKENGLSQNTVTQGQRIRIPYVPPAVAFLPAREKKEATPRNEEGREEKKNGPRIKGLRPPSVAPKISVSLAWPVEKGVVSSGFGIRKNGKHDGVDIVAPEGTKITAAADGTVIFSGGGPSGYGNIIVLKHSENLVTIYAHNQKNTAEKGTQVKQGETIALVGHTGRTTTPHCHFEVRVNRVAFDPLEYLPKR